MIEELDIEALACIAQHLHILKTVNKDAWCPAFEAVLDHTFSRTYYMPPHDNPASMRGKTKTHYECPLSPRSHLGNLVEKMAGAARELASGACRADSAYHNATSYDSASSMHAL